MLRKNIENQACTVQHLNAVTESLFEIPQLARRQLIIKDHQIVTQIPVQFNQFVDLSRSNQRCWIELIQALPGVANHLDTSRPG
jgi:hypothetical protein